jgi:ubiquinone/menaquinone biosynthesis C-methylase UbiE
MASSRIVSVGEKKPFTVDDAYALETPGDSIQLYGEWAETYDSDFVAATGYIAYRLVAQRLALYRTLIDGPVLDVGCGTGMVGVCLQKGGFEVIDGLDISRPMLTEAGEKKTAEGDPVYRNLISADLTRDIDISDDQYAALVSAGTFTHGHLGPDSLDELWRVAAPGAWCVIGVRTTHFDSANFREKLQADVSSGTITKPDLAEVPMYSANAENPDHANDKAYIVVCQLAK